MALRFLLASSAGLALLIAPAAHAAQDGATPAEGAAEEIEIADGTVAGATDEMEQAMAMFGAMFMAEPLTAEQEARLPQAQRIISRMIPAGTLSEMMGSMFDKMLGPIMQKGGSAATTTVTAATGLSVYDLDLTPDQAEELAALFDPAWAVRQERELAMLPQMMTQMVDAMEPSMRKAMAELYAITFNPTELAEIEAFFLTDTGTNFARKSFTMSSDPRILSATMEAMPTMMGAIKSLEQKLAEATADLPAKREFTDLTPAEQDRVAELTGYALEEIAANLSANEAAAE